MDARIQKLRERLAKQRSKVAEMEAQAAEMEKEIKKAEEEQLGYLARSAANTLSGGMEEVFELLRSLRANPNQTEPAVSAAQDENPVSHKNSNESKEGVNIDGTIDETEETEETEV